MKERIRGDRRTKNRFELVGTLPGTLETWHRHRIRNLSPGGALVESSIALPPGSRLIGRLSLQGIPRDVKAEVRYAKEDGNGPGAARYLIGLAWADGTRPMDDVVPGGPIPRTLPGDMERRQWPRVPPVEGTEMNRPEWSTVKVLDISVSGVMFLAPERMAAGTKGQLRLRLGDNSFVGDIEIRRSDRHQTPSGGYRIGATFTSLADGSRASLEDFIGMAGR
ncbi:MAG: PilZ domain-containing protein [Vicinamibacterales bacterium]